MKSEKGISLIALLLVIVIIFGGILLFKVMSDKKETENTKASSNPNTSTSTNNNGNSPSTSTNNNSSNTSGLRKDFKQAMDSYEAFMDEYIAFIMKYNNSNKAAPEMIKDYAEYMKKLAEMGAAFEKWESNNLNKEEAKYYVEVQMRVNQKLMNASIDIAY